MGNEVSWQVENYEPDPYETFSADILWASYWKGLFELEARVGEAPGDLEAVLALAEAYRAVDSARGYIESEEFFSLNENTILQALALEPSAPELNAQ